MYRYRGLRPKKDPKLSNQIRKYVATVLTGFQEKYIFYQQSRDASKEHFNLNLSCTSNEIKSGLVHAVPNPQQQSISVVEKFVSNFHLTGHWGYRLNIIVSL